VAIDEDDKKHLLAVLAELHSETAQTERIADERRLLMLQCHAMQLERQVLAQQRALQLRENAVLEASNAAHAARDAAARLSAADPPAARDAAAAAIVRLMDRATGALAESMGACSADQSIKQWLAFTNPFVQVPPATRLPAAASQTPAVEGVTLLDVCSATTSHINLRQVARLEAMLRKLHARLLALRTVLRSFPGSASIGQAVEESCGHLQHTALKLVSLSVLLPAAPLPDIDRVVGDVPEDPRHDGAFPQHPRVSDFSARLRELGRKAPSEAVLTELEGYDRAWQHHCELLEERVLAAEDQCRRLVRERVPDYGSIERSMAALWERRLEDQRERVHAALSPVLRAYDALRANASEAALREFLSSMREYSGPLRALIDAQR
jgi:hypothetical protein